MTIVVLARCSEVQTASDDSVTGKSSGYQRATMQADGEGSIGVYNGSGCHVS